VSLSLNQFYAILDKYSDRIPINALKVHMNELDISMDEIQDFVQFSDNSYRRNLMHEGPMYQALIICWKNGQRSPIHNHKGSSCGVKLLKGVATETLFVVAPNNLVYPTNSEWLYEGDVTGSENADIHQVSNLQDESRELVTLHIYSPALLNMDCYSLESNEIKTIHDPIYGNGDGI
jgi:cysteine dioxygenase